MKDSIEYTTLRTENKLLRACIIKDTDQEEWREEYRNFESALTFKAQTCRVCRITVGTVTYIGMVPYVLR